ALLQAPRDNFRVCIAMPQWELDRRGFPIPDTRKLPLPASETGGPPTEMPATFKALPTASSMGESLSLPAYQARPSALTAPILMSHCPTTSSPYLRPAPAPLHSRSQPGSRLLRAESFSDSRTAPHLALPPALSQVYT